MKVLITGSNGFVGGYLRRELEAHGYCVTGMDLQAGDSVVPADLLNADAVAKVIRDVAPDVVFHLAGQTSVSSSWKMPQRTMEVNINGALNLMDAVRAFNPAVRVVMIGSSDQYGKTNTREQMVSETMPLHPQTPYAVSKRAQEEITQIYIQAYGMNICMTRSFNHGGAGQQEGFMIPDFAAGIVRVERGEATQLRVGNLTACRDFTHVKDVVRAYRLIAEYGTAGEIYNVGSGRSYSARDILDRLCSMAKCPIPVYEDPGKMRPNDNSTIRCNYEKLTHDTGWKPVYTIDDILWDTLEFFRNKQQST